jgi:hypothetical protein
MMRQIFDDASHRRKIGRKLVERIVDIQQIANGFSAFQAIADRREIAWTAAAKRQATQGTLKVRHRFEPAP